VASLPAAPCAGKELPGLAVHRAFRDLDAGIGPASDVARAQAHARWNAVAKPIGSLGVLEDDVARIAALTGSPNVELGRRAVAVFCADNGVVAEGVSQCGAEVTAAVAAQVARGRSSVCRMASTMQVDAFAIDMGMACPQDVPGLLDRRMGPGTGDIACGPAMTRDQALRAIQAGIELAGSLQAQGYGIVACGEMGIGDTTTASAMACAFFALPVERVVGRGAGLSDAGLARKRDAVRRALAVNVPCADDALDVLYKLGGFEIAGMTGLFIGGALHRIPIVIDGFISAIAAYTAFRLVPACVQAMLASHVSAEPAAALVLERLGLRPVLQAGMYLGEGAGAVCLIPLLDAALALYSGTTFQEAGIDAYDPALAGSGGGKTGADAHNSALGGSGNGEVRG
jgi:nicotinate-nucleotide--dimethylbenzimidazole phosphoribosyltransferase